MAISKSCSSIVHFNNILEFLGDWPNFYESCTLESQKTRNHTERQSTIYFHCNDNDHYRKKLFLTAKMFRKKNYENRITRLKVKLGHTLKIYKLIL